MALWATCFYIKVGCNGGLHFKDTFSMMICTGNEDSHGVFVTAKTTCRKRSQKLSCL